MDRKGNLTSQQLEVYETIRAMLNEMNGKIEPLFVTGIEIKRKFKNKDIRAALSVLHKKGLIERQKGINDYLLTIKENK